MSVPVSFECEGASRKSEQDRSSGAAAQHPPSSDVEDYCNLKLCYMYPAHPGLLRILFSFFGIPGRDLA